MLATCIDRAGTVAGARASAAALVVALVTGALLFTASAALGASGNFSPAPTSPETVGAAPKSVAVADFNADGKQDLATAGPNALVSSVTILLGDGTGNFTAAATSPEPVGPAPTAVVTGDFNGDGKPDLAVTNRDSNNVSILLNNGDGSGNFTPAAGVPTVGSQPESLAVGDFNGAGGLDLAVANRGSNNVTILLGDGAGAFTAAGTSPETVGTEPRAVAVGDFTGDGKQDLAVAADFNGTVTILIGDGTGNFTAPGTSPETVGPATRPLSVAVGDFNGAGGLDLATANSTSDDVAILLGDGTGNFTAPGTSPEAAGDSPASVAVGDFNGDLIQDLATANGLSHNVTILFGDGTGNFTAAPTSPEAAGTTPQAVAVGDFNGAGGPDLAVANQGSANVTILLNDEATVAVADTGTTVAEDANATAIDVRANDTDVDSANDKIASVGVTVPTHGTVVITNGGNDLTYKPTANYCGPATFTYTLIGGSTATVSVTVTCVEDPAVAFGDSGITVAEDSGATTIDVRINDSDPDVPKDKIATVTTTAATHGTVLITNAGDDLSYTPGANYCGSASFTYKLTGGSEATVLVNVSCSDDPTVAVDDSATVAENAGATTVDVRSNDVDPDAKGTIASVTPGANTHGTVAITNGGNDLTYTPDSGFCGPGLATFTYTLTGGSTATVSVDVDCLTTAVDDARTVAEDAGATTVDVRANDTDLDTKAKVASVATGAAAHGTVAITNGGNDLTFTPTANYCGPATFTYTLGGGSEGDVAVTVTCVEDGTVALDDAVTVAENAAPVAIDVRANDTDVDSVKEKIQSVAGGAATHGTVAVTGAGDDLTYTPDKDYCGGQPATFTYTLAGGATATVAVTVACAIKPVPPGPPGPTPPAPPPPPVTRGLSIAKSGSGTVTSSPAGIACGALCSASLLDGTAVTLTAKPGPGAVFAGWAGACSGTAPTCRVSLTAARSVTALFVTPTEVVKLPAAPKGCVRRNTVRIVVATPKSATIKTIKVFVNGKAGPKAPKGVAVVDLRKRAPGRYTIKTVVTLSTGKSVTVSRTYKGCGKAKAKAKKTR